MLRRLYRWAVRLHPSSFRRRFGDEMLYIFDQQKEPLAALGMTLDCVLSLLRQWTLRPRIGVDRAVTPAGNSTADNTPLFETFDTFPPRKSAIIYGALLSLILLYMIVSAIPYSGIDFSNRIKAIVGSPSSAPAAPAQTRGTTIWLDQYVGEYVSDNPPEKISIQIEGDAPGDNHLSLSLTGAGHSSLALTPASQTKFIILGVRNSYVDFTSDAQGEICCLSLVVNGKAITARRQ